MNLFEVQKELQLLELETRRALSEEALANLKSFKATRLALGRVERQLQARIRAWRLEPDEVTPDILIRTGKFLAEQQKDRLEFIERFSGNKADLKNQLGKRGKQLYG